MPVEKYGWLPWGFERLGIHQRMHGSRDDFDRFESGGAQIIGHPSGRAFNVWLVFAFRAHTRYAQKLFQLCQMLLLAAINKFGKVHIWGTFKVLSEFYTQLVVRML